jgi:hypothetical protein
MAILTYIVVYSAGFIPVWIALNLLTWVLMSYKDHSKLVRVVNRKLDKVLDNVAIVDKRYPGITIDESKVDI